MDLNNMVVPRNSTEVSPEPRITITGRTLNIPLELQSIGVTGDNDVERVFFEIPRYFDEVNDLTTFNIYVMYTNAKGEGDLQLCTDVKIEGDNIVFSWLTSKHLYKYAGDVTFALKATHADTRSWGSDKAHLTVTEGLDTEEAIIEQDYDFINQQFQIMADLIDRVNTGINRLDTAKADAEAAAKSASAAKTSETNAKSSETESAKQAGIATEKANQTASDLTEMQKMKIIVVPLSEFNAMEKDPNQLYGVDMEA